MVVDKIAKNRERRKQDRLEHLCTNKPDCHKCGCLDWQCLGRKSASNAPKGKGFVIECRKCKFICSGKIKRLRTLKRSSVQYHACTICGDDKCYLEDNHIYCFEDKEICVPLCANCHAIITDAQNDHPKFPKEAKTEIEALGLFLLNIVEIIKWMIRRQRRLSIIIGFIKMLMHECSLLGYKCFEHPACD